MKKKNHQENWNHYIGKISLDLFKFLKLPKQSVVVEIAPGEVNKIGIGLEKYGFSGTLFIVEPHPKALKEIIKKYKKSLKKAKIIGIKNKLNEAISFLPGKVDAIIANHPLDDILLGKIISNKEFKKHFGNEYGTNPEKTKKIWQTVKKSELKTIKNQTVQELKRLINHCNPRFVILSQYESYFYKTNNNPFPDKHAYDVLRMLAKSYEKNKIDFPSQINNKKIDNPKRWLILKKQNV